MIPSIKSYAIYLLGLALGISLAACAILSYQKTYYQNLANTCKNAVVAVNKEATQTKERIETKDVKLTKQSEDRVSTRVRTATDRLHDSQGRITNLSRTSESTSVIDSPGGEAVILPDDQRICVINTILAEEWQQFWAGLETIREEENVSTNP